MAPREISATGWINIVIAEYWLEVFDLNWSVYPINIHHLIKCINTERDYGKITNLSLRCWFGEITLTNIFSASSPISETIHLDAPIAVLPVKYEKMVSGIDYNSVRINGNMSWNRIGNEKI